MRLSAVAVAVLALAGATPSLHAQAYPTRPVRIIVGYPPGGGVDVAARIVAQGLTEVWGTQSAIVDNRPGAAGGIGTELTAAATPDGNTLMLCNIASHAITPARAKKLPYDPVRDFAFISMVGTTPNVIVTHPQMAMKNLKDVIAYAKKNPGKLNYGSSGVGASPNLSVELMKLEAGVNIVHVPYKGAAIALSDVMSGHLELMTGNLPGPLPQIKAGKVRALAVTSGKRNSRVPDVPTIAEQGLPNFDVSSWYGICTQAAVPKTILEKLRADLLKALDAPETKKRLYDQAIDVRTATPEAFVEHVKAETARWARVVREANIPPQ
ncbi:MAG TPA: tripartite tricarboxylate transporter substrate binding protein [Burkholderiales bacterium]|nr:tripartite tricarboxylate transporter substrate binding protein [Burkholderiales bacterium]